ncbi:MAG: universal stress protein, partial [Terracidiphilus sp.]
PPMHSSHAAVTRQDYAQARTEKQCFASLAERAKNLGVHCKIVVRQGLAADEILAFLGERRIDRAILGTHSPGPVGKLLLGSVAETVLRNARIPVSIVSPYVIESAYRHFSARTILCPVTVQESSRVVARFAGELAFRQKAVLILQHVVPYQEREEILAGRSLGQLEEELRSFLPSELRNGIRLQTRAVIGDPTEELLYQGRSQHANLIVMGAQGASHFAAISRAGMIYKVLAYAQCPVLTLSPAVLAECGVREERPRASEVCVAGVF